MFKTQKTISLLLILFLSLAIAGCTNNSMLVDAAQKTYQKYIDALNQGNETSQPDIPILYWTSEIKGLSPLQVYVDRSNVVIVQTKTTTVESGLYINLPLSSYRPDNGDGKFSFTKVDENVYKYTRIIP